MAARLRIYRKWPDGESLQADLDLETSYPDALDQGRRTLVQLYAEALGVTLATDGEDNDVAGA